MCAKPSWKCKDEICDDSAKNVTTKQVCSVNMYINTWVAQLA